jgi:hypothetical protein
MTRFPQNVRQRLYGGKRSYPTNQSDQQIEQAQPSLR